MSDWYWSMIEKNVGLEFDEKAHRYTFEGRELTSVTTLLKTLCEPFDAEANAQRMADAGDFRTKEQLLAEWARAAEVASLQGDYVHKQAEAIAWKLYDTRALVIQTGGHPDEYRPKLRAMWSWFADHQEIAGGEIFPELKVVYPEYRIAGTVDLLCKYQGVPSIVDYKTNKSIDLHGFRNMLPPFQRGKLKLDDSNFWTYSLQLNMYRRILIERYSYEAEKLVLVHLTGCGNYVEYDVPIMDSHIDKLLESRDDEII